MNRKLEVCTFNLDDLEIAAKNKVSRVELCINKNYGGITPPYHHIIDALSLGVKIHPIIRPRAGNFIYTSKEINSIINDVRFCRENNCSGVVLGVLDSNNEVDISNCKKIIKESGDMSLTFHRAFDETIKPYESMEKIIDLGFDRILTSGQEEKASDGVSLINKLVKQSKGRISIMPGSGIRASNVDLFLENNEISEIHSSCYINGSFSEKELVRMINKVLK